MIFDKKEYTNAEIKILISYIQNYVSNHSKELDCIQGYQLGVVTCNLLQYSILQRDKKPEDLDALDLEFLENYDRVLERFPDLVPYLKERYQFELDEFRESDPEKFKLFNERREFELKHED